MRIAFFLCLIIITFKVSGQTNRIIDISFNNLANNKYKFNVDTTQATLVPIAGSEKLPYYRYWWEFGDGNMSTEKYPTHQYGSTTASKDIYLTTTNVYDNGNKPPIGRMLVPATQGSNTNNITINGYFPDESKSSVFLKNSSDAKPEEEIAFMLSYRNQSRSIQNGQLAILFNERKFNRTLFEEMEVRSHFGEQTLQLDSANPHFRSNSSPSANKEIPINSTMQAVLDTTAYQDQIIWTFDDLNIGEERNLFFSLYSTENMLRDTSATLTLLGVYTDKNGTLSKFPIKMSIVTAHDPNKARVSDTRVSFRKIGKQKLTYTIDFQNEGKGDANRIRISTSVPEYLDNYKVIVKDYYPEADLCELDAPDSSLKGCLTTEPKSDSIIFLFSNVALPGLRQQGLKDKDATKGWVKFEVVPKKKIKKRSLQLRGSIVFNEEKPIITNTATTRFKAGLSIGIKGGISDFKFGNDGLELDYPFVGLTFSPFKSEKFYYQGEIMVSTIPGEDPAKREDVLTGETLADFDRNNDGVFDEDDYEFLEGNFVENVFPVSDIENGIFFNDTITNVRLDIVPLQLRKDFLPFIGAGVGLQTSILVNRLPARTFEAIATNSPVSLPIFYTADAETNISIIPSLFADVNIGLVKQGPSIGIRYHYELGQERNASYFRAYALVKF